MIAYDCDTRSVCTGPAPFDANVAPCCDEHEEEWTRGKVRARCGWGNAYGSRAWANGSWWDDKEARSIANHAGVAPDDMQRFLRGEASLTYPARIRIREVLNG